jgi:hypothetical protein
LTKRNIDVVSSTKIFITNLPTLKNLVIFEKNRDDEYFNSMPTSVTINDILWDSIIELKNIILSGKDDIIDLIDSIVTEVIDSDTQLMFDFYDDWLKYRFINPDINQITESDIALYPNILNVTPFMLNADLNPTGKAVIEINPDMTINTK